MSTPAQSKQQALPDVAPKEKTQPAPAKAKNKVPASQYPPKPALKPASNLARSGAHSFYPSSAKQPKPFDSTTAQACIKSDWLLIAGLNLAMYNILSDYGVPREKLTFLKLAYQYAYFDHGRSSFHKGIAAIDECATEVLQRDAEISFFDRAPSSAITGSFTALNTLINHNDKLAEDPPNNKLAYEFSQVIIEHKLLPSDRRQGFIKKHLLSHMSDRQKEAIEETLKQSERSALRRI